MDMLLDDSTKVYIIHKTGLAPIFGTPVVSEHLESSVVDNIRETTLGELSSRINAKVLNVQEIFISTDYESLSSKSVEINEWVDLFDSIMGSVQRLDVKKLRGLEAYVRNYENKFSVMAFKDVPWQSFGRSID